MPYVIALLIIIICLLYPPFFTAGLILFALLSLISLFYYAAPLIGVIGGGIAIYIMFFLFGLEDDVVDSVVSRQGSATVSEVLSDLGVTVSNRDDCVFGTCRVYDAIENLLEDGDLSLSGSGDEVRSTDQVLWFTQQ